MNFNKSSNGRVDIEGPNISVKFSMIDKIPINDSSSFRDALNGNLENTILSQAFFSNQNLQILQNGIRAGVYKSSTGQHLISPQDTDVIKTIMRAIYLENSVNLPYEYTEQIIALNQLVIDYSIKQLIGELDGYMKYKRDASTLITPLPLPILSSTTKTKTLELKPWF